MVNLFIGAYEENNKLLLILNFSLIFYKFLFYLYKCFSTIDHICVYLFLYFCLYLYDNILFDRC